MRSHAAAAALCATLLLFVGASQAQPGPHRRVVFPAPPVLANAGTDSHHQSGRVGPQPLKKQVGIQVAQRLLASEREEDRLRGLRRLGSAATAHALQLLIESLEKSSSKNSRTRLTAVRALAPHAQLTAVRQALIRVMTGVGSPSKVPDRLEESVRQSAALALAASRTPEALQALAKALRHEGPTAEAAAVALEAHPPRDITALTQARGAPTRVLVRLLARLGDQRAFHPLRSFVRWGAPEVRAEAAVALTRLGDLETASLARHWLKRSKLPTLKLASARILALVHAPDAPRVISKLLEDESTRNAALQLALQAPHPRLVAPLERLLAEADAALVGRLLAAIGRAGGEKAASVLAQQLSKPSRAAPAAYALALTSGPAATQRLAEAMKSASTRRLAARAAVVRQLALGERVDGTEDVLHGLLASSHAADRAAGAWGLAALDAQQARALLASKDLAVVRSAARTALAARATEAAARRLVRETDPPTRTALSIALSTPQGANHVPTRLLLSMIEEGGAAAPLAAHALAARDCRELRPRIEALLQNADPLMRAHTALGLARSQPPSGVGLLARTYRLEPDADVRRAVVVALSQRRERTRRRTLRLAAHLDGDTGVREAARLALAGQRLSELGQGAGTFWLSVVANSSRSRSSRAGRAALVQTPSGLALPLLEDPDGLIVAAGLPEGPVGLRLAIASPPEHPQE